ncbi:MAG TPA: DsbA family protein [Rhizomicrobium sp.]|nr:DsbA family protein [Rhizomicrobium sp.]
MTTSLKTAALGAVMGAVVSVAAVFGAAQSGYFPPPSDRQFHDYLMAHPGIIFDMQAKVIAENNRKQDRAMQEAVDKVGLKTFFDPKLAFVTGPANAKKSVVEFFDYNCGHCRNTFPVIKKFYEAHKADTRFAFIEFPIFGQASEDAARSALAARRQGDKYIAFHFAMMSQKNAIGPAETVEAARTAGLDLNRLMADLKDPAIAKQLATATALAKRIGAEGTPLFIVNGKPHPGEVTEKELLELSRT